MTATVTETTTHSKTVTWPPNRLHVAQAAANKYMEVVDQNNQTHQQSQYTLSRGMFRMEETSLHSFVE